MASIHEGKKFGALTVLSGWTKQTSGGRYKQVVRVQCDCGAVYDVNLQQVQKAKDPSCAACHARKRRETSLMGYRHPLYSTWLGLIHRCYAETSPVWRYYGGRGITVCDRWLMPLGGKRSSVAGFHNFLADMGNRPAGTTLDRIDVDGDYCPENCRWADWVTQANNKTSNVYVTVRGVTKTVAQWSTLVGTYGWYAAACKYGFDPAHVLDLALAQAETHRWDWQELLGVDRAPLVRKNAPVLTDEEREAFAAWLRGLDEQLD